MSVKIYSTPTCSYCNIAKKYFKEHNIDFTDYNVMVNPQRAQEMVDKSGQRGVPVIDINGKIIVGFNRNEIEKNLKR